MLKYNRQAGDLFLFLLATPLFFLNIMLTNHVFLL